ncbi:DUF1642 domain-containing protein [Enterococcus faecalis]|uniref:DUF1642 domain-containing protein n=1 Tax=Enterococcus faecalis TaxID=1351 RepID=UPI00051CE8C9|nr:DUF1642 domain-containing protein [Enterococcus faecalis]KGJ36196.1 hypothetical protein ES21_06520 [Enterococcus faecalis]
MDKQELIEELECLEVPTDSYNYLRGANYAVEKAISLAKQLKESKKAVVPNFVAEYIEIRKRDYEVGGLGAAIIKALRSCNEPDLASWMNNNTEVFARAWLDGYEVEEEPLYYVKLPDLRSSSSGNVYGLKKTLNGEIRIAVFDKQKVGKTKDSQFTENQIKAVDERYWPFAVKVEEE